MQLVVSGGAISLFVRVDPCCPRKPLAAATERERELGGLRGNIRGSDRGGRKRGGTWSAGKLEVCMDTGRSEELECAAARGGDEEAMAMVLTPTPTARVYGAERGARVSRESRAEGRACSQS